MPDDRFVLWTSISEGMLLRSSQPLRTLPLTGGPAPPPADALGARHVRRRATPSSRREISTRARRGQYPATSYPATSRDFALSRVGTSCPPANSSDVTPHTARRPSAARQVAHLATAPAFSTDAPLLAGVHATCFASLARRRKMEPLIDCTRRRKSASFGSRGWGAGAPRVTAAPEFTSGAAY
jgi:hypothetical protein